MDYVRIGGTDFHLMLGAATFERFKKEGATSFCIGLADDELAAIHGQIKQTATANGYNQTDAGEAGSVPRKNRRTGRGGL